MIYIAKTSSVSQKVQKPTRGKYFRPCSYHKPRSGNTSVQDGMSDHDVVISNLYLKAKVLKNKARRVFIYSKADIVNIKRDIVNE